ncbi:MAG: FAD-binding oxidoreductase [Candidatus Nanopelagicales bacterium]
MAALLSDTYRELCLWQEQADPPVPALATPPRTADLVIIGAGLCGLAAATTAARAGRSVVVLDKERLGWGASSRNGGMVIPELKAGPGTLAKKYGAIGDAIFAEVNEAFDFVEDLARDAHCDYLRTGMLMLAHSPYQVSAVQHEADDLTRHGQPAHFVRKEQLPSEVGSSAFAAGMVLERTGALHPAKFHAHLARQALAAGVQIHDRTAATHLAGSPGALSVLTTRGGIRARDVLVATNAYADDVVPWLHRRVTPVSSYIIATEVLDPDLARSVSPTGRMMVDTKNFLFYWRLTPDGRVAFGGRRSLDPVDVATARDFLYDSMIRIHPQLAGTAVDYAWGGSVAVTLDRMPHAGIHDGAWYATGCNGSGVATNTWLGHRIAQHLTGQAPPPAVSRIRHRAIPASRWSSSYLPVVSRYFAWQDSR